MEEWKRNDKCKQLTPAKWRFSLQIILVEIIVVWFFWRTNSSNLFYSNSFLRKKSPIFFYWGCITSCLWKTLNFILSWITLGFKERKKNFLGLGRYRLRHKVSSTAFLLCAFRDSLGAGLRPAIFQFFPFSGEEGQGKIRKAKKRLRKSLPDSYRTITNCHLAPNPNPISQHGPARVLQILQTTSTVSTKSRK